MQALLSWRYSVMEGQEAKARKVRAPSTCGWTCNLDAMSSFGNLGGAQLETMSVTAKKFGKQHEDATNANGYTSAEPYILDALAQQEAHIRALEEANAKLREFSNHFCQVMCSSTEGEALKAQISKLYNEARAALSPAPATKGQP